MKLSIEDRLILMQVLPREGDIISLKIIRDLMAALGFSEAELKDAGFKEAGETFKDEKGEHVVPEGQVHWDKNIEKDVEIGPKAMKIIVETLEELNKHKRLPIGYIPIYEKFMGE